MKPKAKVFKVIYDKAVGSEGQIIVKASNEQHAIKNAEFLCFTGSNFRDPIEVDESLYIKPRKQGFFGSHRQ